MKRPFMFLVFLLVLPICFSEIIVSGSVTAQDTSDHSFTVNKYYTIQQVTIPAETREILVMPVKTESSLLECQRTNLSIKLANPSSRSLSYSFSIENFKGTAYISPEIIIPPRASRLVFFGLSPCDSSGDLNPLLRIESESEIARVPILLHVQPVFRPKEIDCLYHYNQTVCESRLYNRFMQDQKLELDLSEWFYDPDGDELNFKARTENLAVKFKGMIAEITNDNGFYGADKVDITAEDENGGKVGRTFYIQVLKKETRDLPWQLIAGLVLIVVLLLLILTALSTRRR